MDMQTGILPVAAKHGGRATKILYILVCVSFLSWLLAIATTEIHRFEPSVFYYSSQLNMLYWFGLVLLISAILAMLVMQLYRGYRNSLVFDVACILVLVLYLFGTPSFIYDAPRFADVYYALDLIDMITDGAGFELTGTGGDYGYLHSFPGAIVFFTFVKMVCSLSDFTLANYYMIYLMGLLSFLLYVLVRRISGNFALLAPVCFLSLSWIQEYHLSPQSMALLLYICLWFFVIMYIQRKSTATYLAIIVLISSIVVSHPGTPVVVFLNIIVLYAVLKLSKWLKIADLDLNMFNVIMLALPYAIWLAIVAEAYLYPTTNLIRSMFLNVYSQEMTISVSLATAQADQLLMDTLRKIIIIAEVALGGLCIVVLSRKETRKMVLIPAVWFISCFLFQVLGFTSNFVFGRFLIFAIFPFSIIVVLVASRAAVSRLSLALSVITIALIVFSALAMPLISYGGDYFEFKPLSDFYADDFIKTNNLNMAWDAKFANVGLLNVDLRQLRDVYAADTIKTYNYMQVKYSKGAEYSAMFDNVGQSIIYDNGDSSLQSYLVNMPS